jgi:hypothetical protein
MLRLMSCLLLLCVALSVGSTVDAGLSCPTDPTKVAMKQLPVCAECLRSGSCSVDRNLELAVKYYAAMGAQLNTDYFAEAAWMILLLNDVDSRRSEFESYLEQSSGAPLGHFLEASSEIAHASSADEVISGYNRLLDIAFNGYPRAFGMLYFMVESSGGCRSKRNTVWIRIQRLLEAGESDHRFSLNDWNVAIDDEEVFIAHAELLSRLNAGWSIETIASDWCNRAMLPEI